MATQEEGPLLMLASLPIMWSRTLPLLPRSSLLSSKLLLDTHRQKTSSRIQRFLSLSGVPFCPAPPSCGPHLSQQAHTPPYTFTFVPFLM